MSKRTDHHHLVAARQTYATVILPIAVPKAYTYIVPADMIPKLEVGKRVEVQFGKSKLYAALVADIHSRPPEAYRPKPILHIIDEQPVVLPWQIRLWQWMASYYACTIGEVMNAALPTGLKLVSETKIVLGPMYDPNYQGLSDKAFMIAEALSIQEELSIEQVRKILGQKTVYPLVNKLLDLKIIYLKEELQQKYKPKKVICLRLQEPYASYTELLEEAFERIEKSERQTEALLAFIQLSKKRTHIRRQEVCKTAQVDSSVIKALVKKEILEAYEKQISRISGYEDELLDVHDLTSQQKAAISDIEEKLNEKQVCLLHGVTGSGKTRVYIELMQKALDKGEQVLYLLPEIALSTQIIHRLQKVFGDNVCVYHSRLNNHERVEMWRKVLAGQGIVLGVRSSLFLPFRKLSLVIIDEEHDTSFKQYEPAPRYNARDAAIYLARLQGAKTLLGTATPSVESFYNAQSGKYGLVSMPERIGGLQLPEVLIVDTKEEMKKKTMQSLFSSVLLDELTAALDRNEQAILFQNRRGYAPTLRCNSCAWHSECIHCDVSLTLHKHDQSLRCHYCSYQTIIPDKCPACGDTALSIKGFGTEKIEDELKIYLPDARIGRMDFDTVRGKHAHARIVNDFEERRLDVLVGTQMVTKGFDFDNVGLVGVLSADHLLQFPDFRSSERAFQMMTQVSGRAGRKHKRGKVIIQAFNTAHPVLDEVLDYQYSAFFKRELEERQRFSYPPFVRLIKVQLKHKKPYLLNDAVDVYAKMIKPKLGKRVIGPAIPVIPRIRTYYLTDMLIKVEKDARALAFVKELLLEAGNRLRQMKGFSTVRIVMDVDPQ